MNRTIQLYAKLGELHVQILKKIQQVETLQKLQKQYEQALAEELSKKPEQSNDQKTSN